MTGHQITEDVWDCLDTSHSAGQLGQSDQQAVLDTDALRPCPAAGRDCLDTSHSAGQLAERDRGAVLDTNTLRPGHATAPVTYYLPVGAVLRLLDRSAGPNARSAYRIQFLFSFHFR